MKKIAACLFAPCVALGVFSSTGCQESMAYINIPADRSDVAWNNPSAGQVVALEAAALRAIAKEWRTQAPATFLLPPGSRYADYQKVAAKAGKPFVLPQSASAGTPVFEVRAIRARGGTATVDIVSTGEIRPLVLTEVNLEYHTSFDGIGWRVDTIEPRRVLPAAAKHVAPGPGSSLQPKPKAKPKQEASAAQSDEPDGNWVATEDVSAVR